MEGLTIRSASHRYDALPRARRQHLSRLAPDNQIMGEAKRHILEFARFPRWCGMGSDDGENMSAVSYGVGGDGGVQILPYLLSVVSCLCWIIVSCGNHLTQQAVARSGDSEAD